MTDGYARVKPSGRRPLHGANGFAEITKSEGCSNCCECRCVPVMVAIFVPRSGPGGRTWDLRPYQSTRWPCNKGGTWNICKSDLSYEYRNGSISNPDGILVALPDTFEIDFEDIKPVQLNACCPPPIGCCRLACGECAPLFGGYFVLKLGERLMSPGSPTWDLTPFQDEIVCGEQWRIISASDGVLRYSGTINIYGELEELPASVTFAFNDTLRLEVWCV